MQTTRQLELIRPEHACPIPKHRETHRAVIDLNALGDLFPHRVATTIDLIGLGITGQSVRRRSRPGGPWQRVLPGVLLLTDAPPRRAQLVQAALRYAGPDALVTGVDALQLHGVRPAVASGPVHLLLPRKRGARSGASVLLERTDSPPRPVLRSGFLTVPLARAVVDATRRMHSAERIRELLTDVIYQHDLRFDELHTELNVVGTGGARLPRQVLRELSAQTRSCAQTWAQELVRSAGLPAPRWNTSLADGDGRPLGTVIAWWKQAGLAWEVDPFEADSPPTEYANILKRGCYLTSAGMFVLHTVASRIRQAPTAVADELISAYRSASRARLST